MSGVISTIGSFFGGGGDAPGGLISAATAPAPSVTPSAPVIRAGDSGGRRKARFRHSQRKGKRQRIGSFSLASRGRRKLGGAGGDTLGGPTLS